MKPRGLVVAGTVLLALGSSPMLAWPLVEGFVARSAEDRLRRETGQDWRIRGGAGLSFRPTPQVTLNDVSVDNPGAPAGLSGSIKRLRLSDPWMLISGAASVDAIAEGITLTAPLSAAPAGIKLDGITMIRANLVGAKLDRSDTSRLVATVESAELGLTLATGAAKTAIDAKLALADHDVTLTGELSGGGARQSLTGPVRFTVAPREASTGPGGTDRHRLEASAQADLLPGSLTLDALAGHIDGAPLAGTLTITPGARPKVVGDLTVANMSLRAEGTSLPSDESESLVVTVPVDAVPVPAWFEGFEASGVLRFARLNLGGISLRDVELKADVKNRGLDLGLVKGTIFEGTVRGRYVMEPAPDAGGRHQFSLSMNGVRVATALADLAGARGINGTGTLRTDLQAKGGTPESLRRSLSGSAEFRVEHGRLNGLDLAGTTGMLPKIIQGVPQIDALATRLDSLSASFAIADGRALTNDLDLRAALLGASGIGSIDLFARTLDIHMKPTVGAGSRAGGSRSRIDVPIRITGPWSRPSLSADMAGLATDPGSAIQTLQDLGSGLLGTDGAKLGETLRENLDENLRESLGGLLDGLLPRQDPAPPERHRP